MSGDFGIDEGYAYGDNVNTLHANDNGNGDDKEKGYNYNVRLLAKLGTQNIGRAKTRQSADEERF